MSTATKHPVYVPIEVRDAAALLRADGVLRPTQDQLKEKFDWLFQLREEKIKREQANPLMYGYRPSIWYVCMAVLGLDWLIPDMLFKDSGETIQGGETFGATVRKAFGMEVPWDVLCILGGNGSTKTHFECFVAMASLYKYPQAKVQMYHTDSNTSREVHQARMHEFLMPNDRKQQRTESAYITWKQKTGFSDNSFILPNRSECLFRYYAQQDTKPEGTEPGDVLTRQRCVGYCADELAPVGLINTLDMRLARFNSVGVIGFTPIEGYTPTVGRFLEGSNVLRQGKAFLVPRDGKEPDTALAFKQEDCLEWFDYADGKQVCSEKSVPAGIVDRSKMACEHMGRTFAARPRVIQSARKTDGVICFFTDDNPFLNPHNIWKKIAGQSEDTIFERYYGWTTRKIAGAFPLFDEDVHGIAPEDIPKEGTNYMIADPSHGRNIFKIWIRCTSDGMMYVYREWPCPSYAIPSEGFPGNWAEPSDDLKRLDGKKGPAQKNMGWGFAQYKKEIARLEGWKQYDPDENDEHVRKWDQFAPAKEKIYMRYLDARFGNTDSYNDGGQMNLFEQFDEWGLTFYESTSGSKNSIGDGVRLINDVLFYNTSKSVDFFNHPKLRISTDCKNLLFAMKIWTGMDGQEGACKDPIDCLRMAMLKNVCYVEEKKALGFSGGGCY